MRCSSFGAILSAVVSVDAINAMVLFVWDGTHCIPCAAFPKPLQDCQSWSGRIATMLTGLPDKVRGMMLADEGRANVLIEVGDMKAKG